MSVPHRRRSIGGRLVGATSGKAVETQKPATGELLAVVDPAGEADVDRVAGAAGAAAACASGHMESPR